MSKAPKTKRSQLHYQPYQSASAGEHNGIEFSAADMPLHMDPVLTGLSSSLSRNLWDDWNESDGNFPMKFDMFHEDAASHQQQQRNGSAAHSPSPHAHGNAHAQQQQRPQQQQQNGHVNVNMMNSGGMIPPSAYDVMSGFVGHALLRPSSAQSDDSNSGDTSAADQLLDQPRTNYRRSLSEDIVNLLDENNELMFSNGAQSKAAGNDRRQMATPPNGLLLQNANGSSNCPTSQQQQQQQHQFQEQLQIQQHQLQQQLERQQRLQQQMGAIPEDSRWMPFSGTAEDIARHQQIHAQLRGQSSFENAIAAASTTLTAIPVAAGNSSDQTATPPAGSTPTKAAAAAAATFTGAFMFPGPLSNDASDPKQNGKKATSSSPNGSTTASESSSDAGSTMASNGNGASNNMANPMVTAVPGGPFGSQGMMMPGFMMYSMPMMGNYQANAMGMMPMGMQLPMGMQMGAVGPMGMQMPMGMGMQLPMGMQMPMGMSMGGLPMGMQMPMALQVNPQHGDANTHNGAENMEITPATPSGNGGAPSLKPAARALQPKGGGGSGDPRGPGFVSIARKPEEPEVSSILKSLMDEEAKKKEKKLERNRDSARESRKKQQTYVETLETGIKRLQINRDLVAAYRWGVTGPGFGPLPCPNSPQMYDWKTRISIVTGDSEAFANIQNPTSFNALMRMNRQRRALSLSHHERERAVWKCFITIGRRLAALRTRVLEAQVLRTFSQNPLAAELSDALQLTADQKLQLQCHAQRVFDEEVVTMAKLFKVFFALRAEAMRLNILSPSLEHFFRDACSLEQLQRLLQWTETHRSVIEDALPLDA